MTLIGNARSDLAEAQGSLEDARTASCVEDEVTALYAAIQALSRVAEALVAAEIRRIEGDRARSFREHCESAADGPVTYRQVGGGRWR